MINASKQEFYVIIERDEDGYYVGEVPGSIPILQKYDLVVRASCSLGATSEQDARTIKK
jgi:hypothetical protein